MVVAVRNLTHGQLSMLDGGIGSLQNTLLKSVMVMVRLAFRLRFHPTRLPVTKG